MWKDLKERNHFSQIMIFHLKNAKVLSAGFKINIQQSNAFQYTGNM